MKFLAVRGHACWTLMLGMVFLAQLSVGRRSKPKPEKGSLRGVEALPEKALLVELEEALGNGQRMPLQGRRLTEMEDELKTTFKALPKNSRGAVEGASARYALHRLFLKRYGWQIKGLETGGGAWDAESPVGAMGDRVPPKMRELFEERLSTYGLTLHELAVLGATMDNMFRSDVSARLQIVYKAYSRSENDILSLNDAIDFAYAYMCSFIIGSRVASLHTTEVHLNVRRFKHQFPRHQEVENLLMSTMRDVAGSNEEFNNELMTSWLVAFGERLGSFEDRECKVMKQKLVEREDRLGSGRVRLGHFYSDKEHFSEGVDYLRRIGALDESVADDPKVIIPNYLASPSNCVLPSGYYGICCFDECEQLMDRIESHFEAPMASPSAMALFVSSLPSASQPVNRTLSPKLLQLLEDVAAHHGGMVPIHGRLFSQWMHQAYPRECSHPHLTASDESFFDGSFMHSWEGSLANFEEKVKYMSIASSMSNKTDTDDASPTSMWSMEEQLVDPKNFAEEHARAGSSRLRRVMAMVALGFAGLYMGQALPRQKFGKSIKEL
eukprot:TRINITY_DN22678_c0_g1_i1.p1 TRINITY_DN22678_c0_g1~~TRINITY_DN22678_c0_g1_i1.p1  ORF type:complete len:553 (+),score=140.46 TRINITY_DN22678_c0_g1_i1:47-1705(+)